MIGLVVLWPGDVAAPLAGGLNTTSENATVLEVDEAFRAAPFSSADLGLGQALKLEVVATEVVATLVGSIGLIAAVPVTTALAASLALCGRVVGY